jgi:outer membrane protein assembly factor BamB
VSCGSSRSLSNSGRAALIWLGASLVLAPHASAQTLWTHFARNESRGSLTSSADGGAQVGPAHIAAPLWACAVDDAARPITFNGQSGPVVDRERVYALGKSGGVSRVFAFRRADGLCLWSAAVPNPITDSWSTPAIDESGSSVVVAAGNEVSALNTLTGEALWSATLARNVVNASPLVTPDVPRRVFITDADGFGMSGRLYCINADHFDPSLNPFTPGQILWSVVVGGTSGNTPALADGRIIVASVGEFGFTPGSILAFDARATTASHLWIFENTSPFGFYGGVSIKSGHAYAATYAFSGGQVAANLVKLDAATGSLMWSAPCNRTDATPIVLEDGRIVLSGGLAGFGASPSIQLFDDHGSHATMLWDSALATWSDTNSNGVRDTGEYLSIGGWTHQPVAISSPTSTRLLVGTLPSGTGTANSCTHLRLVDLNLTPTSPSFVQAVFTGAGSTPAVVGPFIFTVGASGLHCFGPDLDVNADGQIDIDDLHAWEGPHLIAGSRDVDRDGDVDATDRETLIGELRRDEQCDMTGPREVGGRR